MAKKVKKAVKQKVKSSITKVVSTTSVSKAPATSVAVKSKKPEVVVSKKPVIEVRTKKSFGSKPVAKKKAAMVSKSKPSKPQKSAASSSIGSVSEIAGLFSSQQGAKTNQVVRVNKDTTMDGVNLKKGQKVMLIAQPTTDAHVSRSSTASEESVSATTQDKISLSSIGRPISANGHSVSGEKIPLSVVASGLQRLTAGQNRNFPVFKTR